MIRHIISRYETYYKIIHDIRTDNLSFLVKVIDNGHVHWYVGRPMYYNNHMDAISRAVLDAIEEYEAYVSSF